MLYLGLLEGYIFISTLESTKSHLPGEVASKKCEISQLGIKRSKASRQETTSPSNKTFAIKF